jgi:LacI family transcriptional regulator
VEGSFNAASGHTAMGLLLSRANPTAVFVASDVVAFGAMRALRECGRRVPADVSIVGFDDIPMAEHFDPPLTTVHLPAHALGAAAGQALMDRVAGRRVASRTLLPTELIVRSSTTPVETRQAGGP